MRRSIRGFALVVFQFLVVAFVASAQVGNSGSIEGVVTDPSG